MDELSRLLQYYIEHQDEFVKLYDGRFIVLVADEVKGDFATEMEAYLFATSNFTAGTFMLQLVQPGKDNYTQTFYSQVIF
jgi:hypothetical protein